MIQWIKTHVLASVTASLYLVTLLASRTHFRTALQNSRHYLVEMIVVMPVILMLTVLIEVWISKETIMKHLGEGSGLRGAGFSVLLGSLSAGPIYAAFPVCKMLLAKGASLPNIVIILSTWAVTKVPMLANEVRFLGPQFMATRWILTVLSIFAMAFLMGILVKKEDIPGAAQVDGLMVNQEYCVGCRICVSLLPDVFAMDQNKAVTRSINLNDVDSSILTQAIAKCPTRAISLPSPAPTV